MNLTDQQVLADLERIQLRVAMVVADVRAYLTKSEADRYTSLKEEAVKRGLIQD